MVIGIVHGEENTQAEIAQIGSSKFSVCIRDNETGLTLDTIMIYPTLAQAEAYAAKVAA